MFILLAPGLEIAKIYITNTYLYSILSYHLLGIFHGARRLLLKRTDFENNAHSLCRDGETWLTSSPHSALPWPPQPGCTGQTAVRSSDRLGATSDDRATPASQGLRFLGIKNASCYFSLARRCGSSLTLSTAASQETHSFVDLDEGSHLSREFLMLSVPAHGLFFWEVQRNSPGNLKYASKTQAH